jgi:membrane-bound serine protease (ClpP class)
MADLWPHEPVTFSGDVFIGPLTTVALGISTAIVLAFLLLRFLPRGWFWDRMILSAAITSSTSQVTTSESQPTLIGRTGLAVTPLYPSGHIEIDGRHYEARLAIGSAENGSSVVVTAQTEFGIIVEKA